MYRAPYIEDSPEEVVRVHEAVDDVSVPSSAGPEAPNELSQRILDAVRNQDEDAVRRLVDDGVNLSAKDTHGQTPLHLAVHNNDVPMVQFLAERGIDLEAATRNGHKALYIAAACGYLDIASLLLGFGASPESFNAEKHETAFYQAVENGHFEVAKLLLQNGADINVRSSTGLTPLFCAVSLGDAEFVEYLLEHGADKKLELEDGRTVEDFANDDPAINILLLSDQVLQGPSIIKPATRKPEHHFTFTPSLPADSIYKQYACHGFDATIMDFFLGDREQRIQVTESIYEILYGQGAGAIMEAAKGPKMRTQQPQLRWYHLPANNMEWVEILIGRIFAEKSSGSVKLDDELKSRLALTSSAGRQYRTVTAQSSSFMRPLYQTVSVEAEPGPEQGPADHTVLFMPYLHFETIRGYEEMMSHIQIARNSKDEKVEPRALPLFLDPGASRTAKHVPTDPDTDVAESVGSNDTAEKKRPKWNNIAHRTVQLRSTFQNLKRQLTLESARNTKAEKEDLEKGTPTNTSSAANIFLESTLNDKRSKRSDPQTTISAQGQVDVQPAQIKIIPEDAEDAKDSRVDKNHNDKEPHPLAKASIVTPTQSTSIAGEGIDPQENRNVIMATSSVAAQNPPSSKEPGDDTNSPITAPTAVARHGSQSSGHLGPLPRTSTFKGKERLGDIPEGRPPRVEEPSRGAGMPFERLSRPEPRNTRVSLSRLDEILIKAYSLQSSSGQMPPLQLRRTLDQYFYTDLSNTHQRDTDQVVLRYTTNHGREPKIFMVDQLWLWILNGDTVISCYPHRWSTDVPTYGTGPPPPPPVSYWPSSIPPYPKPITSLTDKTRSFNVSSDAVDSTTAPVMHTGRHRRASKGIVNDVDMSRKQKPKSDPSPLMKYSMGEVTRVQKKDKIERGLMAAGPWRSSGPTSSIEQENKRRRQAFLQEDPLNVHQTILKNLYGLARAPITSAYDLATLITSSCVDVFDQYKIPPDFQFFDFFESSIGAVIEKEAQCFKRFTKSLDSEMNSFGISAEAQLLVEIKDIRDELGILEMVLNDQEKVFLEFYNKGLNISYPQTKVLWRHRDRIRQMDKLAEKTYQALNGLLDLKQKQANVSEALSARKQAEIAAEHAEQGAEHARQATLQAVETTRQGRTVLLFTVVTIIFLPLSFMAAFFAISIDSFPVNDNGRLPMNYVLKYMLTISAAISIPFILVAFNQDRITRWLRGLGKGFFWWSCIFVLLLILLPVIWTSHLASNIKGSLTAVVVLLALVAGIGQGIYALFSAVRRRADNDSYMSGKGSAFSSLD